MSWGAAPNRRLEPEEPEEMPRCPECGEECEWLYRDRAGQIVGCEHCVDKVLSDDI